MPTPTNNHAALVAFALQVARMSTFEDWVNEQTRGMNEEDAHMFEHTASYLDIDLEDAKATLDALIYTARKLTGLV